MSQPSVCLIVAFYFGARDGISEEDSLNCLNAQIHNLNKYKHNLTDIIFAISEDHRKNIDISKNKNIIYFYRPNEGLSFGAWIDVMKTFRDKYDYYICLEDDYYFIKNHFDSIMINEFNNNKNIGYLTTWINNKNFNPKPFIKGLVSTIGITSSKVLKKINYFDNIIYFKKNIKQDSKNKYLKLYPTVTGLSNNYNAFLFAKHKNSIDNKIILYGRLLDETIKQFLERAIICPYQLLDDNFDMDINKINQLPQ